MEQRYLHACPEAKERLSQTVERGQIGALVKRATGFKCQVCDALGLDPVGFRKRNGEPYVEAHHVMPVAKREVRSLAAGNVITLCANHHRQMHYGAIQVEILPHALIDGIAIEVPRLALGPEEAAQDKFVIELERETA